MSTCDTDLFQLFDLEFQSDLKCLSYCWPAVQEAVSVKLVQSLRVDVGRHKTHVHYVIKS